MAPEVLLENQAYTFFTFQIWFIIFTLISFGCFSLNSKAEKECGSSNDGAFFALGMVFVLLASLFLYLLSTDSLQRRLKPTTYYKNCIEGAILRKEITQAEVDVWRRSKGVETDDQSGKH